MASGCANLDTILLDQSEHEMFPCIMVLVSLVLTPLAIFIEEYDCKLIREIVELFERRLTSTRNQERGTVRQ